MDALELRFVFLSVTQCCQATVHPLSLSLSLSLWYTLFLPLLLAVLALAVRTRTTVCDRVVLQLSNVLVVNRFQSYSVALLRELWRFADL